MNGKVVVEKLINARPTKIFTDVYGTRNFIPHAKEEECSVHRHILILSSNLDLDLEFGLYLSGFSTKISDGLSPQVAVHMNRTRHRWEDNIKTDVKGICCEDVDWIYLA